MTKRGDEEAPATEPERPSDYTPPTYMNCPHCGCGFDERPGDNCPACKKPFEHEPPRGEHESLRGRRRGG